MTEQEMREQKAIAVGGDRKKLKQRLKEAKSMLKDEFRSYFQQTKFDFEHKRLIALERSPQGRLALEWRMREFPDQPESYHNQQTSCGSVFLIVLNEIQYAFEPQKKDSPPSNETV